MILVLLGTQELQFVRLVKEIDHLLARNTISEEVFVQMGHTKYTSNRFQYRNFLTTSETEEMYDKASLIITHGGVGSILKGLKKEKTIIVCPRLKHYNEHIDDHQLEIAHQFSKDRLILQCNSLDKLTEVISKAKNFQSNTYRTGNDELIGDINKYLMN